MGNQGSYSSYSGPDDDLTNNIPQTTNLSNENEQEFQRHIFPWEDLYALDTIDFTVSDTYFLIPTEPHCELSVIYSIDTVLHKVLLILPKGFPLALFLLILFLKLKFMMKHTPLINILA
jgi:hypothetical protein